MAKIKIQESLGNGFKVIKENPILIALAILVNLPGALISLKVSNIAQAIPKSIVALSIVTTLITVFFTGMIVRYIYESREKKPSWGELINFTASRYILLLLTFLAYTLLTGIGAVLLVIPGIFLLVKLMFCDCGVIIEKLGIIKSLKISWAVTKGNWWRCFTLAIAVYLPIIVFTFSRTLIPKPIFSMLNFLLGSFTYICYQSIFTLVYLQLRKKE